MELLKLSEVFDTEYGNSLALSEMIEGKIPFIARGSKNNGISAYVAELSKDIKLFEGHCITVALSGSVLECFYQKNHFYTGYHIKVLKPINELSEIEMLIYCSLIRANKYRYNFGRQANRTLENIKIPHPNEVKKIASNFKSPNEPSNEPDTVLKMKLDDRDWGWFIYEDIFNICKGKRLTKLNMEEGATPFVGAIDSNNGVSECINDEPIFSGNTITVSYNGSVAEAFYQPSQYWASDDINILSNDSYFNPFIGMFLITLIKQEKYRFSYGRKWHKARMEKSKIKLPVDSKGEPDWQFMEDYIRSLPYSSNL